MRPASFFVLAVLSSACWSLTSTVPDVTGGAAGPNDPDSAPPGDTDGGGGGTEDGSSPESGPPDDASFDGGQDGGDGAVLPYCATLSTPSFLCDDFGSGARAPAWTKQEVGSGGSVEFVNGTFIARARQPCAGGFGQLTHTIAKKTANVKVGFTFRTPMIPANAVNHVTGFQYYPASGYYRVDLATVFDHLELVENLTGTVTSHQSTPLTFSTARRIELAIDFVAKNAVVKVDGVQRISVTIQAPNQATDDTRFELGLYAGDSCPGAVDFVYDDVTYERQDR